VKGSEDFPHFLDGFGGGGGGGGSGGRGEQYEAVDAWRNCFRGDSGGESGDGDGCREDRVLPLPAIPAPAAPTHAHTH